MARKNKYPNVNGLEYDIDQLYKTIESLAGKTVNELPHVDTVSEDSLFYVLNKETNPPTYNVHKKINGVYRRMYIDINSLVYWE